MVKMGEVSGNIKSQEEAIQAFNHHFTKYKNFRAVQIDSKYKMTVEKKDGTRVVKLVQAADADDAKRIVLRRNKSAVGTSRPVLWRKQYVVFADPK